MLNDADFSSISATFIRLRHGDLHFIVQIMLGH